LIDSAFIAQQQAIHGCPIGPHERSAFHIFTQISNVDQKEAAFWKHLMGVFPKHGYGVPMKYSFRMASLLLEQNNLRN
jgi:hypothetical protein